MILFEAPQLISSSESFKMSFGFGVGDFIVAALLVKDIVDTLNSSQRFVSEYRDLARELSSLERILLETLALNSVETKPDPEAKALAAATRQSVLQCNNSLQTLQRKLKDFEKGPKTSASASRASFAISKIKWTLHGKDDLVKSRAEIAAHKSSLHMLLLTAYM